MPTPVTQRRSTDAQPQVRPSRPAPAPSRDPAQTQTPRYLIGEEPVSETTPNYAQLSNQQTEYDEAVCSGMSIMPQSDAGLSQWDTEPSFESSDDGQTTDLDSAEPETDEQTPEDDQEQAGTEEASSEEESEQDAEGATAEEATSDESEAEEPADEETERDETGAEEAAAAQPGGDTVTRTVVGGETEQVQAVMAAKIPYLVPIRTPFVPSPPPPAVERRKQIIAKTGSPPELHHAQVRQSVQRVAQAARDAQRQIIRHVGGLANDTRISIEQMAREILGVTAAAMGQINTAIDEATDRIEEAALAEMDHIEFWGVRTGEDVQATRDAVMEQIFSDLQEESTYIDEANDIIQDRFSQYLGEADLNITNIPATGEGVPLPMPASPRGAGGGNNEGAGDNENPPPADGCEDAQYRVIGDAETRLETFMDNQASITSEGFPNVKTYKLSRSTPVMEGFAQRKQADLETNAEDSALRLNSEATRAQFAILALSLTAPVSQHHREDQGQSVDQSEERGDEQLTEAEAAVESAKNILRGKSDRAVEYCNRDLRDTLTGNIRKSGHKAHKGLKDQAKAAEGALNSSAVPMAEAYRDLVDRLSALLPPGQFLDKRQLVPKLLAARDSARQMLEQHETVARLQSTETIEKMKEVKKQQADAIAEAGQKSAQSVSDIVTRSQFDFALFSSQMTGELSEGAINGMTAARDYADRMARDIIAARDRMEGDALPQVDTIAVGFLNSSISAAAQSQYQSLKSLVDFLEQTNDEGLLTKPMSEVQEDLDHRASAIDNALPGQSSAVAAGLTILSPLAAGVYLYCTDADEDVVIEKLGNLMWPGILGLEEIFNDEYGSLRDRIREEMDSPEKSHALRLFSEKAAVRAQARLDIAEYSTGWFDYNRAARESALQGMSSEERATLSPQQINATRAELINELDEHQGAIASAYLDGNRERAVAARTRESLDKARGQGEWGWIFSAESARQRSDEARVQVMADMQGVLQSELAVEHAYIPPDQLRMSTQQVYQEFAAIIDPRMRRAEDFSAEEAQNAMIAYATSSHNAAVLGIGPTIGPGLVAPGIGLGLSGSIERIRMSDEARQYITDLVQHGVDSNEARESRAVYEFRRAEGDSMFGLDLVEDLSETSQTRLSDAFENRRLAQLERQYREAGNPRERSQALRLLEEERATHRQRLQHMAQRLGAPADVHGDPARAEAWMAKRVGSLFAREDDILTNVSHARYGQEMITGGRASLVAGVALATEGAGTHDDLLRRSYQDRSHAEIRAANAQWARENEGEDMEVMLGIRQRTWETSDYALAAFSPVAWLAMRGSETSGDLAMELQRLALGNRETDLDYVTYAGLHYNQERVRGTGFIAEVSMQGTPEQRNIDNRRDRLARTILDEAARRNPEAAAAYRDNPGALFGPDGTIDPAIQAAAFENGNFRGNSSLLQHQTQSISLAADAYRAEIDRQESMLTTGITVLALVASIALMCIPGVNVVAAGVISAVIAGAATMIVKAGMRGERYGWEEAAVDLASTAIEAATAGFGGAIAGGLGRAGGLARIGTALTNRLGKVGGAVVREALVSAISSGAQVAMQDDVWKDGLARGLERVMSGSLKGAAVAAVTAGVAEGLTNKLNRSMSAPDFNESRLGQMERIGRALGPHGSEIFRESISELAGSVAGESVGVLTDYATGQFQGNFGDALKRIGQAGLRDMATGAMRSGVTSMNRARYRSLLDAARTGGTLSPRDMRALRLAAISAGAMNYDDGPSRIQKEIDAGRQLLAQLPPSLREQAANLDMETLDQLVRKLDAGDLNLDTGRNAFLRDLGESVPGFDGRAFLREMQTAIQGRRPSADVTDIPDAAHQSRVRGQLAAGLDDSLKSVINDVHIEGLEKIHETDMRTAADMIARGEFDSATADALLRRTKQNNPELNEYTFLRNLHGAVETSRQAQEIERTVRANRHREVMAAVPDDGRKIFADLPDESIARVKDLLDRESLGTPHEQKTLFQAAQSKNPELTWDRFQRLLTSAVDTAAARHTAARQHAREQRREHMLNVPESHRGILSALPDDALIDLRIRQLEGEPLSPAERNRLIDAAQRETPDVDVQRLSAALDETLVTRPRDGSAEQQAKFKQELAAAVPADQRHLLGEVPILILRASEFEAFTRSESGQAVTLIVHGRPVVVMRESADPGVLREEGIHVLQSKDPRWSDRLGTLDESKLSQWDKLPLAEQMALYRNKVAIEIDAQHRLAVSLEADLSRTADLAEQTRLRTRLEMAQTSLRNLENRAREAGSLGELHLRAMEAGLMPRPAWLDQPARLFEKDSTRPPKKEALAQRAKDLGDEINLLDRDDLITRLETSDVAQDIAPITNLIKRLPADTDIATQQKLATLALLMRQAGMNADDFGHILHGIQVPGGDIDIAKTLATRLPDLSTARKRESLASRVMALAELQRGLRNIEAADLDPMLKTHLREEILIGSSSFDAAWSVQRQAYLDRLGNAAALVRGFDTLRKMPGVEEHFSRLVDIVAKDTRDPAQELSRLIPVVKALSPDQLGRMLSLADDTQTARYLFKAAAVSDADAFVRDLTTVLGSFSGKGELLAQVKTMLFDMSPRKLRAVVDGLGRIKDATPIEATFHAMVDTVLTARYGQAELSRNLADLAQTSDARGRKALASLIDQMDKGRRSEYLRDLLIRKNDILKIEKSLFGKESGKLLSLLIETAATQRNWNVTLDSALEVLSGLSRLPQNEANQENIGKIIAYFEKQRGDLSAEPKDFKAIRDNPDLAQLASDFIATATLFRRSPNLEKTVGSLVKNLEDNRPLAGKDSWRSHLENEAVHWERMRTNPESEEFAAHIEKLTPGWSDGERALLRGMQAWFDRLTKIKGMDGDGVTDRGKREALLQDILKRGFSAIRTDYDLKSKGKYDSLARAFKEMTVEAGFAADPSGAHIRRELQQQVLKNLGLSGKDLNIGPDGIDRQEVLKRMDITETELTARPDRSKINQLIEELDTPVGTRDINRQQALSRLGITEAQLAQRSDRDLINQHINALMAQESKYQRMLAIAGIIGGSTAGIRQNITEVVGEIALSREMLDKHKNFELAMPFGKGTGFDQVWVRRVNNVIEQIMVGEAKGPGAALGHPTKGAQMTAKWVLATIRQMIPQAGTKAQKELVEAMMKAVLDNRNSGNTIKRISGIVIQAGDPPDYERHDITKPDTGKEGYDFSGEDIP